ncbi:MAG TPA: hypothetical protein VM681_06545 [Candidatus Thermoplasmatota archaeon]|nr:hypothetical protein [Candidatus Thermoplasmatota archaeon]
MIDGNSGAKRASQLKEVKIMIPVNQHIRLHSVKVLTGKPISDTVTEALEQYFTQMGQANLATHAAPSEFFQDMTY